MPAEPSVALAAEGAAVIAVSQSSAVGGLAAILPPPPDPAAASVTCRRISSNMAERTCSSTSAISLCCRASCAPSLEMRAETDRNSCSAGAIGTCTQCQQRRTRKCPTLAPVGRVGTHLGGPAESPHRGLLELRRAWTPWQATDLRTPTGDNGTEASIHDAYRSAGCVARVVESLDAPGGQ